MDLAARIQALRDPAAYPDAAGSIGVRQTHLSAVFLTERFAYKIKKPVVLPFVDQGTLERRRALCEAEVLVNRRLAPSVYLAVVPIVAEGDRLRVEGAGDPIEWAVKMRRLPDADRLGDRLDQGRVDVRMVQALAERLASFHRVAEGGPAISNAASADAVAALVRANLAPSELERSGSVHPAVLRRLRERTEQLLEELTPVIDGRANRLVPRDTHGDLRLDHVYLDDSGTILIVDAIEFSPRLRYADPVADIAFLGMDLDFRGRRDLGRILTDNWFASRQDDEGRALLAFYKAYRALVRAKVDLFLEGEPEVPRAERGSAADRARGRFLQALGELGPPGRRPGLVLIGGLPGTGKSTLARRLAEEAGLDLIQTDQVRKEGRSPVSYADEAQDLVYQACCQRAADRLFQGGRALMDATFLKAVHRRLLVKLALDHGVPAVLLVCQAPPEIVRARLEERRGDHSDATWEVHRHLADQWEDWKAPDGLVSRSIDTDGPLASVVAKSIAALREAGLCG